MVLDCDAPDWLLFVQISEQSPRPTPRPIDLQHLLMSVSKASLMASSLLNAVRILLIVESLRSDTDRCTELLQSLSAC